MRITILKLAVALLFYCPYLLAQGNSAKEYSINKLKQTAIQDASIRDSLFLWQERVVLHTDKSLVVKDEPLFFKAYMLTGPNRLRVNASNVLIVDLVDSSGEAILTQYHGIKSGATSGSLDIPKKLADGNYFIRAYTRWMKNYGESFYYSKRLVISGDKKELSDDSSPAFKVTFHPEGGHLFNSLANRVVIKAVTENGTPAKLQGTIVSESGSISMPISKYDSGLFSATFTPRANEVYQLTTSDGRTFNLPRAVDEGYQLSVNNLDSSKIIIIIKPTKTSKSNVLHLKGEMAGVTYFKKNLKVDEGEVKLDILKNDIPHGIMKISLFDENREWASRFINIEGYNRLNLEIFPLERNEEENGIAIKLLVKDNLGNPVETELSLSARSLRNESPFLNEQFQEEHFWATSSKSRNREVRFLNDIRMIAADTASFDFSSTFSEQKIQYPFQKGLELYGYAYDLNNTLLKNKEVQVISGGKENVLVKEEKTDDNGMLRLTDLNLTGENEMVFRTKGDDSKSRLVKFSQIENPTEDSKEINKRTNRKRDSKKPLQPSVWQPIDTTGLIELDEVDVKEGRIKKRASAPVYGIKARQGRVVIQDPKRPKSIFELLIKIPGITVSGNPNSPNIGSSGEIFGNAPTQSGSTLDQPGPLWVVDGMMLENSNVFQTSWGLTENDIERIEFISPYNSDASMWGSRADKGVFLIYTRNGSDIDYVSRKEGQFTFKGYHKSIGYDSYNRKLLKRSRKDQVSLFWDPNVKTDENGEAIVRFKTPPNFDNIMVNAKTITEKGEIGSGKAIIRVIE
ncbi:hypothetical protein FEE95_14465 [Maribacter algarum]|uniref:TonB-dependent Receptor Plug Domain n=1 Tax=Maribacter algarum (ex Zhang et al. 2020) TaxID=2578118 RepID=A0A5S3PNA7_9FLAO|nr:hypothetical protein [Maribacter algarum]TMM55851.1 hypothetical protein FEE95_14465 [Maribacter algarum]